MNDTPSFTVEQIDELLSAELDGEFDAAARDLGLDPADARDRLAAQVPGLAARRAALGAARDVLSEVPAVDELVVARVRAKAVKAATAEHEVGQASRSHRLRRLTAIAGGLAAAIAVIAGLSLTMQHNKSSASKTATAPDEKANASTPNAAGAADKTTASGREPVDFGAVADLPTLVADARGRAAHPASAPTAEPKRVGNFDAAVGGAAATSCASAADQVSGVGTPTLQGVATLAGTSVRVYVFRSGADETVVVLSADCRLVTKQTLHAPSG